MKTLLFILALPLAAQTNVAVGRMAMPPQESQAVDQWLVGRVVGSPAQMVGAVLVGDTTIALPASLVAACSWTYPVVSISSTANVSTITVETMQVPTGSQIVLSGAVTTPAYNATFIITSAPTNNNLLTFALTIANNAAYDNANVNTNGFNQLTYARCAVLIDNEAIGINGTANGTVFFATRGDLNTIAAAHAAGAQIQVLKYPDKRHLYRSDITALTANILQSTVTPKIAALQTTISTSQAQIVTLQNSAAK